MTAPPPSPSPPDNTCCYARLSDIRLLSNKQVKYRQQRRKECRKERRQQRRLELFCYRHLTPANTNSKTIIVLSSGISVL
jgi:hypothetical protein